MAKLPPKKFVETVGGSKHPNNRLEVHGGGGSGEVMIFMTIDGRDVGDIWLSKKDVHALCVDLMERLVAWDD